MDSPDSPTEDAPPIGRPQADRPPTREEERAAERGAGEVDIDAARAHEDEMNAKGAAVRGEGAIEPETR